MTRKMMCVIGGLSLTLAIPTNAAAQNGPYYATPSWDQTLPCDVGNCPRFVAVIGGNGQLDRETGLVWESNGAHVGTNTWANAQASCLGGLGDGTDVAGPRKGWRLGTIQELASLVDTTQSNPALPAGQPFGRVLPGPLFLYWSATTDANDSNNTWAVDFSDGSIKSVPKTDGAEIVWCVRGGPGVNSQ